jgi:hypothetical protein
MIVALPCDHPDPASLAKKFIFAFSPSAERVRLDCIGDA